MFGFAGETADDRELLGDPQSLTRRCELSRSSAMQARLARNTSARSSAHTSTLSGASCKRRLAESGA